jgi:hypothetical protein
MGELYGRRAGEVIFPPPRQSFGVATTPFGIAT